MKKFFQKIGNFFGRVFGGIKKFERFLSEHIDDAIDIVGKLRAYVENPASSTIGLTLMILLPEKYLTKGGEVLEKIKRGLDAAMSKLEIGQECLGKENFNEKILCLALYLKGLPPSLREGAYRTIAAEITKAKSGESLKDSRLNTIVEMRLLERKEGI
jgi:hypothetical protein